MEKKIRVELDAWEIWRLIDAISAGPQNEDDKDLYMKLADARDRMARKIQGKR